VADILTRIAPQPAARNAKLRMQPPCDGD